MKTLHGVSCEQCGFDTYEGTRQSVRRAAERHASETGHEVMVYTGKVLKRRIKPVVLKDDDLFALYCPECERVLSVGFPTAGSRARQRAHNRWTGHSASFEDAESIRRGVV